MNQQPPYMGGPAYGPTSVIMPYNYYKYPQPNRQLHFLETPDLPDMPRLTNDLIQHSQFWPRIPTKLPSDISKFDGKPSEDPNNHVMSFYLWFSLNSLMDDSIHLRLFQRTLTSTTTKWYVELPSNFFIYFGSLAMAFLTHF